MHGFFRVRVKVDKVSRAFIISLPVVAFKVTRYSKDVGPDNVKSS